MNRAVKHSAREASERNALRRRVRRMHASFNRGRWQDCYALLDPRLTEGGRVELASYSRGLREFKAAYGVIRPWHTRINLHLDASSNKHDPRPFAFVYLIWQDEGHGFHLFRERWVLESGQWYSRVAGLAANKPAQGPAPRPQP